MSQNDPCASCPYRKDVPSGLWDKAEYDKILPYDNETWAQPLVTFGCHKNGEVYIVEGVPYDAGYINAAKVFGDIEYRQEDYVPSRGYKYGRDVSKLMLFRGDGFDGMIMPRWGR
jgi:hypothetical protein